MKKLLLALLLIPGLAFSQTIGKTSTEQYKASFEIAIDISAFLDYEGPQIRACRRDTDLWLIDF